MNKQMTKSREIRLWDLPQELIDRGRDMAGRGREVWLAGLGAVATVEEEGSNLFNRLVERGHEVESEGKKQLDTVRKEINARQNDITQSVEETVYEPLLNALKRFGVPTRGEMHDLTARVENLTRKVDVLVERLEAAPREKPAREKADEPQPVGTVYFVMARDDGWIVGKEGVERAVSVHATKEEAVEAARIVANEHAPSRLNVYKKDGTIQDTFSYVG